MGLVAPAAALSLDAPAIGLRAREAGGEPGGEAFFGLLAQHLQSKGASDQAIAVITAKAGTVVAPGDAGEAESPSGEGEADTPVAVTVPIAPIVDLPALPAEPEGVDPAPATGATGPELAPPPATGDPVVDALSVDEVPAQADPIEAPTIALSTVDELVAAPATPPGPSAAGEVPEAAPPAPVPAEGEDATNLEPQPPPGEVASEVQPSVVRTVGNATELEAQGEMPAPATLPDDVTAADAPAASPDLAPASANATATTLLTSQAPPADAVAAPAVEASAPAAPTEQVADVVIERLDDGGGEARLVLDPPDLGEVVIRLHTRADHVRVEVVVERPEALLMLREGSPSLQALLAQRGLDLGDATFLLSQQQGKQHGEAGEQTAEAESGFAGLLGFDEPGDPTATHNLQRLRSAYNPDGALLYRV